MHTLQVLEKKLGYTFRCKEQLQAALYHSSYANEHRCCGVSSNERLEFLGDAVLGLVTADYLYHKHPDLPEGDLTRMRAALVCEESLYEVAQSLGLGTTWCGLLYWCLQLMLPELLPELGLPETHSFQYAMLLGEPAIRYARTVEYGPATVHRIQWK